jgi:hypothetical protein
MGIGVVDDRGRRNGRKAPLVSDGKTPGCGDSLAAPERAVVARVTAATSIGPLPRCSEDGARRPPYRITFHPRSARRLGSGR